MADPLPLDLPAIPILSEGAPTLAKRLAEVLAILRDHCHCELSPADEATYGAAVAALAQVPQVPAGVRTLQGTDYLAAEDGRLTPLNLVKPWQLLQDELVRRIAAGALAVNASLGRFKALSFAEAQAFLDVLAEDYQVKLTGKRGDVYLYTYDRAWRVSVTAQERVTFGPGIEVAKQLLAEWLQEEEASGEVKAIVGRAFQLDDQKQLRVNEILRLRKFDVKHEKWRRAMDVIAEAMETIGTREYLRVYRRDGDGTYQLIALDLAAVTAGTGRAA